MVRIISAVPHKEREGFLAESAFIVMAIREYLQDLVRLSEIDLFVESRLANQTMQPTALLRYNFSVFATALCRGLSLSR